MEVRTLLDAMYEASPMTGLPTVWILQAAEVRFLMAMIPIGDDNTGRTITPFVNYLLAGGRRRLRSPRRRLHRRADPHQDVRRKGKRRGELGAGTGGGEADRENTRDLSDRRPMMAFAGG